VADSRPERRILQAPRHIVMTLFCSTHSRGISRCASISLKILTTSHASRRKSDKYIRLVERVQLMERELAKRRTDGRLFLQRRKRWRRHTCHEGDVLLPRHAAESVPQVAIRFATAYSYSSSEQSMPECSDLDSSFSLPSYTVSRPPRLQG
jgi:hypothetical protein